MQRGIKNSIEWRERLIWSKVFLGLTRQKLCSRDLACMGCLDDHCIPTSSGEKGGEDEGEEARSLLTEELQMDMG